MIILSCLTNKLSFKNENIINFKIQKYKRKKKLFKFKIEESFS